MPRPRNEHPTPAELEVLKVMWDSGPSTVREVMDELGDRRAYTSVMSLLNVMTDKRLLKRRPQGRAFLYSAAVGREKTLSRMIGDLWQRAYEGSASSLVVHLLEQADPTEDELEKIHDAIDAYRKQQGDD